MTGLPLQEVVARIRGREGTKVTIQVRREGTPAPLVFELIREKVERRLKGVAEVQEVLEGVLRERYAPRTQTLTHNRTLPTSPFRGKSPLAGAARIWYRG